MYKIDRKGGGGSRNRSQGHPITHLFTIIKFIYPAKIRLSSLFLIVPKQGIQCLEEKRGIIEQENPTLIMFS